MPIPINKRKDRWRASSDHIFIIVTDDFIYLRFWKTVRPLTYNKYLLIHIYNCSSLVNWRFCEFPNQLNQFCAVHHRSLSSCLDICMLLLDKTSGSVSLNDISFNLYWCRSFNACLILNRFFFFFIFREFISGLRETGSLSTTQYLYTLNHRGTIHPVEKMLS